MVFSLSRRRLAVLKTTLRNVSPAIGSSHAAEALASAFGFNTHAGLLARFDGLAVAEIAVEFEALRLIERLEQLGYGFTPAVSQRISMVLNEALMTEVMANLQQAAARAANDNMAADGQ